MLLILHFHSHFEIEPDVEAASGLRFQLTWKQIRKFCLGNFCAKLQYF